MESYKGWINVNDRLPVNSVDAFAEEEVIGWVAPYGDLKRGAPDFVHFDGEDWYDRDSRSCTVTHWKSLEVPDN